MKTRSWVWLAVLVALADRCPAEETAGTDPFQATGYLDLSYSHLSGDGVFVDGVPNRVFDTHVDNIALQQAALNLAYQPKDGFGGVVNATFGDDAHIIRAYDGNLSTPKADLTQAYLQYAAGKVTVAGGKFVTLAGAEVIPSPANTNFSRSILFGYAIPFTHTGIRATFAPSDQWALYLGVNNGWDDVVDTNSAKTLEVGAGFTPSKAFTVAAYGYFGRERVGGLVGDGLQGERSLVDVVATWNVSEAWSLVVNVDWGRQAHAALDTNGAAGWSGLAGYLNYTVNECWKASLRAEVFDDQDGYRTGIPQHWHELTGTLAYLPGKHVELRTELRFDGSNRESFQLAGGAATSHQQSAAVQALFKY